MGTSTETAHTIRKVWGLVLVLGLAGCASPGRGPGPAPPPPPGPLPGPTPQEGGAAFPRHVVEPIKQMTLRKGRLGWGGVEVGMTFEQAERAIGRRLPALGSASRDELCGWYAVDVEVLRQPLRLEFSAEGGESRLQAIWLLLRSPAGGLRPEPIVRALKARFPGLEYVPSPHAPDLAEASNPKPLYRLAEGTEGSLIFVNPAGGGIYFGAICVD